MDACLRAMQASPETFSICDTSTLKHQGLIVVTHILLADHSVSKLCLLWLTEVWLKSSIRAYCMLYSHTNPYQQWDLYSIGTTLAYLLKLYVYIWYVLEYFNNYDDVHILLNKLSHNNEIISSMYNSFSYINTSNYF